MLAVAAVRISCKEKWSIQPCAVVLQYSRDAFLHQLDGVCGGGRAAYADSSQAVPGQHSHRQCHTGHQLANICVSCAPEQREVRLTAGNSPPSPFNHVQHQPIILAEQALQTCYVGQEHAQHSAHVCCA